MNALVERDSTGAPRLKPEKVAYWYFRLNGFLQIENFVVHPPNRGAQRTDADLLGVRFPQRAEFLLDHDHPMLDDIDALDLSPSLIDVVIVEVKTNQPCTLNGPWTRQDRENVHRVIAAIGCLPRAQIYAAAADIYQYGRHQTEGLRIRLIAVGRDRNAQLGAERPAVVQLTWLGILSFVWDRLRTYRRQKRQVEQWDLQGLRLKKLTDECRDPDTFRERAFSQMGIRRSD